MDGIKEIVEVFRLISPETGVFGAISGVEAIVIWKLVNIVASQRERNFILAAENKRLQEGQISSLQENAKVLERNAAALTALDSGYRQLAQVVQSFQTWILTLVSGRRDQ